MPRSPIAVVAAVLALVGAACRPAAEPATESAAPADAAPGADPAPPWSAEGLEAQPRMQRLRRATPPELGFEPGTTDWRPVEPSPAAGLTAATPGELLLELAGAAGGAESLGLEVWEYTLRVYRDADDAATGIVLSWGFKDDAVAGHDLRVRLRRVDGAWRVERVEERFHCARGVADEGLCV